MYSFLIPPEPGTVDKNPISHTVHNSTRKAKARTEDAYTTERKKSLSAQARPKNKGGR